MTWKSIDTQQELDELNAAFCWRDAKVLQYHATSFVPPDLSASASGAKGEHLNVYVLLDGGTSGTRFIELALLHCDKTGVDAFATLHLSGQMDPLRDVTINAADGSVLLHCARLAHRRVNLQGQPVHYFAQGSWLAPRPAEPAFELLAIGISGPVRLDLHEALRPTPSLWSLDFQVDGVGADFRLSSPNGVTNLRDFLQHNRERVAQQPSFPNESEEVQAGTTTYSMGAELVIHSPEGATLRVATDGDLPDHFIVTIGGADSRVSFDICGPLVSDLLAALDDLITNMSQ